MLRIGKCKHQIGFLITSAATFLSFSASSLAQNITTDGTTGSARTLNGPQYNIPQSLGTKADKNLFHSFGKFNLDAGESAIFQSGADISNIFSRVTGGTPSSINGLISTSSNSVNLFFINPNGIIFGENASLDVGGSFVGTTLERLVWNDGSHFSATKPEGKNSLLKITGDPTGFVSKLMQPRPVTITGSRLQASGGNNLLFLGGNVNLDRSSLTLSGIQGGKIELAGISEPETVGLEFSRNQVGLSFSEDVEFADISLSNGSEVGVSAGDDAEIRINARNLDILSESKIVALNTSRININASNTVTIDGVDNNNSTTALVSIGVTDFAGKGGDIDINTGSLSVTNGGLLSTNTAGQGDGGNINIIASNAVTIDGLGNSNTASIIGTFVQSEAEGKGGDININTGSLSVSDGGALLSGTNGKGDGGSINIAARDRVTIDGVGKNQISSSLGTIVRSPAEGKGGNININTGFLSITNGGILSTGTFGSGDSGSINIDARDLLTVDGVSNNRFNSRIISLVAQPKTNAKGGDINIKTASLRITNGASIRANTIGKNNAGSININVDDTLIIDGEGIIFNNDLGTAILESDISTTTLGQSKASDINITTGSLRATNGGNINAFTGGEEDAGNIIINARDLISFDGESSDGMTSGVETLTSLNTQGDGGNIIISTGSLSLTNGAQLDSATAGEGGAGSITINARDNITFDGKDKNGLSSGAVTSVRVLDTKAKGGDISISTGSLSLTNGAQLDSISFGKGDAGSITINASDRINLVDSGISSNIETTGEGNAGDIDIFTGSLSLSNGAELDSAIFGKGNAGNITINARERVIFDGEGRSDLTTGAFTSVEKDASGKAGNISISTGSLLVTNGAQLSSSTLEQGDAGSININARNDITFDGEDQDGFASGAFTLVGYGAIGNAGDIRINTGSLLVSNGAQLISTTRGKGDAGDININAHNNITFDGEDEDGFPSGVLSNVQSTAMGDAGNINISAGGSLFIRNRAAISASSRGEGNASNIFIIVGETLEANNGEIQTDGQSSSGGRINITAENIRLFGDSNIRTNVASGTGGGGNIILTADIIIALDDSDILSFARNGKGGDITFNTEGFFSSSEFFSDSAITNPDDLDLNDRVDVNASGTVSGNITGIPDTTFIQNSLRELPANQIDTNALISQSCIVRNNDTGSTFNITGSSGFPHSPGNADISSYPTNQVRGISNTASGNWKKGDPIVEPDGVYRLPDGRFILSHKCS